MTVAGHEFSNSSGQPERSLLNAEQLVDTSPVEAIRHKAGVLGLKSIDGFYSMRAQDTSKRRDLVALGNPLGDLPEIREPFTRRAVERLYPSVADPNSLLQNIATAASQSGADSPSPAAEQARRALADIDTERHTIQHRRAFDEVGTYARHAGWVAARAANADLLVAKDTGEAMGQLAEAGYKETAGGYGSFDGPTVPFNNDLDSTRDVVWMPATGTEPGIS